MLKPLHPALITAYCSMSSNDSSALLLHTPHTPVCVYRSRSVQSHVLCTLPPDSIFEFSSVEGGWACLSPREYPRAGYVATASAAANSAAWCCVGTDADSCPVPFLEQLLPPDNHPDADAVTAHRFLMSQASLISLTSAQASGIIPTLCSLLQSPSAATQVYACCACRTAPCLIALTSSAECCLQVLHCLQPFLASSSHRLAASSAVWAVVGEALAAHPSDHGLSNTWKLWCDSVLCMQDESELTDALNGLALSITCASRQRVFVGLGILQLLLQLLRELSPQFHQNLFVVSVHRFYSGDNSAGIISRLRCCVLAVISNLCENLATFDGAEATAHGSVACSELLPLIVASCSNDSLTASELELSSRILWLLSTQCSAELLARDVPAVACRLLRVPHEGALANALLYLGHLSCASSDSLLCAIQESGALHRVVSLLRIGSLRVQELGCWCIRQLVRNVGPPIFVQLHDTDIVSVLLPLTRSDVSGTRRQALAALCALVLFGFRDADSARSWFDTLLDTGDEEGLLIILEAIMDVFEEGRHQHFFELFGVNSIVRLLQHSCASVQCSACSVVCMMVSESNVPAVNLLSASSGASSAISAAGQVLYACGIVGALSELVRSEFESVQVSAIESVSCLCYCNNVYQELFGNSNFAEAICNLFYSTTPDIQEKAARAVWVLCKNFKRNQDLFHHQHIATSVTRLLESESASVQEQALVATWTLCHEHSANQDSFCDAGCARAIQKLAISSVDSVQEKALVAIRVLCKDCAKLQDSFGESGCVGAICMLLKSSNDAVQLSAIGAANALSLQNVKNQDDFYTAGCSHSLVSLLSSQFTVRSRMCCSAIQSICEEHPANCAAMLDAGATSSIFPLLSCSDSDLRKLARSLLCTLVLHGELPTEHKSNTGRDEDKVSLKPEVHQFTEDKSLNESVQYNAVDVQSLLDDHNRIAREFSDLQHTLENVAVASHHVHVQADVKLHSRSERDAADFHLAEGLPDRLMATLDENSRLRRKVKELEDLTTQAKFDHMQTVNDLKSQLQANSTCMEATANEMQRLTRHVAEKDKLSNLIDIKENELQHLYELLMMRGLLCWSGGRRLRSCGCEFVRARGGSGTREGRRRERARSF
jgi:hypothetical protein